MDEKGKGKYGAVVTGLIVAALIAVIFFAARSDRNPHGDLTQWTQIHGEKVKLNPSLNKSCLKCHPANEQSCLSCHQSR